MGEGSKPELVTETPLTRGTGNHGGPTASSGRGSSGSGRLIVIENVINSRRRGYRDCYKRNDYQNKKTRIDNKSI